MLRLHVCVCMCLCVLVGLAYNSITVLADHSTGHQTARISVRLSTHEYDSAESLAY